MSAIVVLMGALVVLAGCGASDEDPRAGMSTARAPATTPAPRPRPAPRRSAVRSDARLAEARCPPSATNCEAAAGVVTYVEAVDPDGDGDAHFVLASRSGITAPGITVVDVPRDLRPEPLPRAGDRVSAAGPAYRGSYGQRQIQAVELHVARRR